MPSSKEFGHTFTKHGNQKPASDFIGRAASKGENIGQWLHNENAANYLRNIKPPTEGNKVLIDIPEGLGQVYTPSGDVIPAPRARVIFKPDGNIRSAYPTLDTTV